MRKLCSGLKRQSSNVNLWIISFISKPFIGASLKAGLIVNLRLTMRSGYDGESGAFILDQSTDRQMQSGQTSKSSYQHYANTDEAFWQIHEGPFSSIRFFIAVGFESRLDQHWLLVLFEHITEHAKKKGGAFVKFQTLELGWTHPSTSHVFRFLHLLQNGWQTKSCKEHTRRIDISFVVFWFFTNSRASLGSLAVNQVGIIGNSTMRVAWYIFCVFSNFRKIIRFAIYCKTWLCISSSTFILLNWNAYQVRALLASQQQGRRPIYQLGVPGSVVQSYHGWPIHTYINLADSVFGTSRVAKILYINSGCSGCSVVEAGRGTKVRGKSRGFQKVRTLAECNYCHLKRTPLMYQPNLWS